MKVLVCISNVPDTTAKITFTSDNTEFNTSGVQYILNPYDEIALAKALELCENGKGTVTVINIGDAATEPTIRKALAIGADNAVRVNAAPLEGFFVAKQIAEFAKDQNFDIIFTGRESIDYNGSEIAEMVGEILDIPSVSQGKKLDLDGSEATIERQIEGGKETINVKTPFIISCTEGLAEPKIPNMRGIMSARTKPLQVIEPASIELTSKVVKFESPTPRSSVKMLSADETTKLIELLHSEAKVI
jgi:electron transfer flavoprotein beta subunit